MHQWINRHKFEFTDIRYWLYCVFFKAVCNLEYNASSSMCIGILMRTYLYFLLGIFMSCQRNKLILGFFCCLWWRYIFSVTEQNISMQKIAQTSEVRINSELRDCAGVTNWQAHTQPIMDSCFSYSRTWNLSASDWQIYHITDFFFSGR